MEDREPYKSVTIANENFPVGTKVIHRDNKAISTIIDFGNLNRNWTTEPVGINIGGAYKCYDGTVFMAVKLEDGTHSGTPPHMLDIISKPPQNFYTILENGEWGFLELEGINNENA